MRKIASYGAAVLLTVSAMAVGVSYAQDTTSPPADTASVASERPWLGVSVSETEDGVIITRVAPGSPAETAQLQVDDVIVAVNDTAIESADDLRTAIAAAASGDIITLTVERADEELSVEVTLDAQIFGGPRGMFADPLQIAERAMGVTLEESEDGYTVTAVDENSPFALEVDDVITAVNDEELAALDWRSLFDPSGESTITLTVQRDGEEVAVEGALVSFGGQQGMRPGAGQPNGDPNQFPPGGSRNGNGQRGNNPPPNNDGQPGGAPPADAPADLPPTDGASV